MAPEDWYARRNDLMPGMVFKDHAGDILRLDRRVPGDGTQWYADMLSAGRWLSEDCCIEPGDLIERLPDLEKSN